jgi:hypothetical protein
MSSRALKRLEKLKLELAEQSDSESEEEPLVNAKPKFNAFALLEDLDESNEEIDKEDCTPIEQLKPQKQHNGVNQRSKPSKSKKKSSKASKQTMTKEIDSDEELDRILAEARKKDQVSSKEKDETVVLEDDFDDYDFEQEFDLEISPQDEYDSNFKYFTTNRLLQSIPLLNLSSVKNFDPDTELRNLFGNLSLESIEDANATTSLATTPEILQQFKKLARMTRGWCGKDRRGVPGTSRKLLLTKIRDDWLPTAQKPMTMDEIKPDTLIEYFDYKEDLLEPEELQMKYKKELAAGVKYFRIEKSHSIQERVANTRFYASVVMTPDPESLMSMLQQYPYHTETLLQVVMVLLRQGGDKSVSYALLEKCLFTFDRSLHKNFHELLSQGRIGYIRLPYEGFMNRQFYLCLFRNIIALGERSTYFTAFSYCKFLLSLSPSEDPLGVRYFIDHYAIMSEEYDFLTKLSESPLCTTYKRWLTPGIAFSTVLAYFKLGKEDLARKLLEVAFSNHPYTALKLLELIGLSGQVSVKESDLPHTEDILIESETYLVRAGAIWNDGRARQFLSDNLTELFTNVPKKEGGITSSIYNMLGFGQSKQEPPALPFNLIRFAILSGENRILAKVPESVFSRDDVLEYDILPPKSNLVNYNVHKGLSGSSVVDTLIDYVDQNLLGTIVQQNTEATGFDDILAQLQAEQNHEEDV